MANEAPINVVVRALDLLKALNLQPVSSVDQLHKQTRIPKPSIVRLLQTLQHQGFVERAPKYGAYYLTSQVSALSSGYHSEPKIVQASGDIADALTHQFKWPVSVAIHEGDSVVVRYSTIPISPLSFFHSTINMRLSMLTHALGRAYLAFCDQVAQDALIEFLSVSPSEQAAMTEAEIRAMLVEVRDLGYALRDPRERPDTTTIAVPIFEGPRAVASLGLTWFTSVLTRQQAVDAFAGPLRQAAAEITLALHAVG
jgi:IclR family mhp operon transcriptional activator